MTASFLDRHSGARGHAWINYFRAANSQRQITGFVEESGAKDAKEYARASQQFVMVCRLSNRLPLISMASCQYEVAVSLIS